MLFMCEHWTHLAVLVPDHECSNQHVILDIMSKHGDTELIDIQSLLVDNTKGRRICFTAITIKFIDGIA